MEYTIIERTPDAFQQSVTREDIIAMCQRAFGDEVQIDSVKEVSGGLYNNTYLIHINGVQLFILRVGPHLARQFRSESHLMRNEYASQPFLAPIAPLLPKFLMVDFTHQILERDYLFQTFMQGEQWSQIMSAFTPEEKRVLWRQLGNITSRIHAVQGSSFANSVPGTQFPSWSLAVIDLLKTIIDDLEDVHLDATDVRSILDLAQAHRIIFDEITQPRLLHGDLWTVNILVQRSEGRPQISAVLDSDRTSWGDLWPTGLYSF